MGQTRKTCLIVGAHFRPPAKAILAHLPAETPVQLLTEPENQYDENAVKVMFDGSDFPQPVTSEAEADLLSQGFSSEEILNNEELFQLGYVAKTGGKPLAGTPWCGNAELLEELQKESGYFNSYTAKLIFGPAGEPLVHVEIEEEE